MLQYQQVIRDVLADGEWEENRTGVRALTLPGAALFFDLSHGDFPAVTTKKLAFKSVIGELCGFMRGTTNAADFRELGCKVWDQNANENQAWLANPYRQGEDDLGVIYGAQWRAWPAYKRVPVDAGELIQKVEREGWEPIASTGRELIYFKFIDQIHEVIGKLLNNPTDRRILFHAWNPAELDAMALPPCHLLYTLIPSTKTKKLSMTLTIRSSDVGLGLPFNIASAAAMLSLFAKLTGHTPGRLSIFLSNAHIYENHMDMVREVLARPALLPPKLHINYTPVDKRIPGIVYPEDTSVSRVMGFLGALTPDVFELVDYSYHPPIAAPMAV